MKTGTKKKTGQKRKSESLKKCFYTVILGNYDTLKEPRFVQPGFDYICFTDNKGLKSDLWKFEYVEGDVRDQRDIKIRPHEYLPEYDLTVYIDGSHEMLRDITTLINQTSGITMSLHPSRRCMYDEAEVIKRHNLCHIDMIKNQVNQARQMGVLRRSGLWESGFMIRRKTEDVIRLCETWAKYTRRHTHRDQLSLPMAVFETKVPINGIRAMIARQNFKIHPHSKGRSRPVKVWYSNPYSTKKNFGLAINEFCQMVPENDWICIQDGDMQYLTPDWGKQIEHVINNEGKDYALLGCMTNRLRSPHQCIEGMFDEMDMRKHYKMAIELEMTQYGKVEETKGSIAGMFMLFPKKTWNKVKFKENTLGFDSHYGHDVRRARGKTGLIRGLYVFHGFRIWSKKPKMEVSHLV